MKITPKLSTRMALAGLLAMSLQFASAQPKESKKAAKEDAAAKDDAKAKKSGKTAPASPVDLNTASSADLEKVPGIGAATAKKIISNRPFSSVADLSKAGLSAKQIQELAPMVMVSPGGSMMSKAAAKVTPAPYSPPPTPSSPTPTPSAATPAPVTPSKSASTATPTTYKPATPPPGPGMVWVNTSTKVFHRPGTKWYGNTKVGKYMSEADAVKAGFRESKEN